MAGHVHPLELLAAEAHKGIEIWWGAGESSVDDAERLRAAARATGASPVVADAWLAFRCRASWPAAAERLQLAAQAAEAAGAERPGAAVAALAALAAQGAYGDGAHHPGHVDTDDEDNLYDPNDDPNGDRTPQIFRKALSGASMALANKFSDEFVAALADDQYTDQIAELVARIDPTNDSSVDADGKLLVRTLRLDLNIFSTRYHGSNGETRGAIYQIADWIAANAGKISLDALAAFACCRGVCNWLNPLARVPGRLKLDRRASERLLAAVCAAHAAASSPVIMVLPMVLI